MNTRTPSYIDAAGGIIYRPCNVISTNTRHDHWEVCLVHRPKYDDWSWPKGKLEPNETYHHAAVREVGEETGYSVTLGPHLAQIEYPLHNEGLQSSHRHRSDQTEPIKRIHYWMMRALPSHAALQRAQAFGTIQPAKTSEINNVLWLPLSQARNKLTHDSDRIVLDRLTKRLKEQSDYRTLLLVRHGKAESRKTWSGSEPQRPLTPMGAAEAYALHRELACYAPAHIVSSPWQRCVQTIVAYATATSTPVEMLPALTESIHDDNPQESLKTLQQEIEKLFDGSSNEPRMMCLHRPIIGDYFHYLQSLLLSKKLASLLQEESPYMPTGSALALHFAMINHTPQIIDIEKVTPIVY